MLRCFYYMCHCLAQITRWHQFLGLSLSKGVQFESFKILEECTKKDFEKLCDEFYREKSFALLIEKAKGARFFSSKEDLCDLLHESLQDLLKESCSLITVGDSLYPSFLLETKDRPLCLFVKGNPSLLKQEMISVVGSRRASPFALDKSFEIASFLTRLGYVIVSGGAYGCDALAHKGALAHGGEASTLAVFAGGFSHLYPKGNEFLFKEILDQGGALVTERLWHQSSKPYDFPIRNRIISGLCWTTLVMDASLKSGTLVTAYKALDEGRNVFVLKSKAHALPASGIELLIEQGALSFETKEELYGLLKETEVSCV